MYTHGALDPLGLADDNFVQTNDGDKEAFDTSVAQDDKGDYIPETDVQHNKRNEITVDYVAKDPDGATKEIVMGGTGSENNGYIITQVVATQKNTAEATLKVTAHKNDGGTHLAQAYTIVTPLLGYGVLEAPMRATTPENITDCVWTASLTHVDKQGNQGDHLVGVSTALKIECTESFIDNGESDSLANDFKRDDSDEKGPNTDVRTRAVRGHKYQSADA